MALSTPAKLGLLALGIGGLAALASSSASPTPNPIDIVPIWQWTIAEVQGGGSWRGYAKHGDERISTEWLPTRALAVDTIHAMIIARGGKPAPTESGPQGGEAPPGPKAPVAALALTSIPLSGLTHNGLLRTDDTWTIATTQGSTVAEGAGEKSFIAAWLLYTNDGIRGVLLQGATELGGFTVRPPPCADGAPNRWCYTVKPSGFVRRSANRAAALSAALLRARAAL